MQAKRYKEILSTTKQGSRNNNMQGTEVNTNVQSQLNVTDNLNGTLARDKECNISSSFPSNRYKDKRSYTFDVPNNINKNKTVLK